LDPSDRPVHRAECSGQSVDRSHPQRGPGSLRSRGRDNRPRDQTELVAREEVVNLDLSREQTDELRSLLDEVLGDLSAEIAATENPTYRSSLGHRRSLLIDIRDRLDAV
jgi:hypothetical protein